MRHRAAIVGWVTASLLPAAALAAPQTFTLHDATRQRAVPVALYFPSGGCHAERPCRLALLSPGYGGGEHSHEAYGFLAEALNRQHYLVVGVQHERPGDPPVATSGDLRRLRLPNWQRGAQNLRYVQHALQSLAPGVDLQRPVLIGHSNGGDISTLLASVDPAFASALVTLDHRRMPLPRAATPRVLSLRASEFAADPGVLPDAAERARFGTCVLDLPESRHADLHDGGPPALKQRVAAAVEAFLAQGGCPP